ncbi:glycosyltransferase family 2 protein [Micromonospora sp. NPDC005237]|uniref:glycosyltransferase family 2 protein n=1 Tax=Micromonospora sp. NPDC005237 TaxID=3155113 RepID=UPI0033B36910
MPRSWRRMLALLITARNEEQTVGQVLTTFHEQIRPRFKLSKTIVVDDDSSDRTAEVALHAGASLVLPSGGIGLAQSFQLGVDAALGLGATTIVHTDADGQYAPDDIHALLHKLANGADLAIGNRLWRRPPHMQPFRYAGNIALSQAISAISRVAVADSQSGYRAFSARLATAVRISSKFTYTQEQIIRAASLGFRIAQTPVSFHERRFGSSRLVRSPADYGYRVLRDLMKTLSAPPATRPRTDFVRRIRR